VSQTETDFHKELGVQMKRLPPIHMLTDHPSIKYWSEATGCSRELLLRLCRKAVEKVRTLLKEGERFASREEIIEWVIKWLPEAHQAERRGKLRPVINATGVLINTNLGRSPLPERALERVASVASGYTNLEILLHSRARGGRMDGIASLIRELTGAEDAFVVNNNAAAVMLALATMAKEKEAVLSRGELVEIGGSFRIPEVMEAAGVRLREVGTTNRTHLRDYEQAIGEQTALLLKVHQSNYAIAGFTKEVSVGELVALGRERGLPVMFDMGCGALFSLSAMGIPMTTLPGVTPSQPYVKELVEVGVDLICLSGDKLLGGPQAGLLVGKRKWVQAAAKQPLARALRVDKLTLSALEATLQIYVEEGPGATNHIPIWSQMSCSLEQLAERGQALLACADDYKPLALSLEESHNPIGGGALPAYLFPSVRLVLQHPTVPVERLDNHLRTRFHPIVGLLDRGRLMMDLRTLFETDFPEVQRALLELAQLS
jgi:L-seryl-tRNA(Ser) seleniumtransferase